MKNDHFTNATIQKVIKAKFINSYRAYAICVAVRQNNFGVSAVSNWGFSRELTDITTKLPATTKIQIWQFIYCHQHSPGLQPHLSTRQTGQTRLTNSQGTIHESWMARCSLCAPGFSREEYAWGKCNIIPYTH